MARKRDYAAEYARRQARARELGFRSFYERRVAGVRKGTAEYQRARGHRGRADLISSLKPEDVVSVTEVVRDARGRFVSVTVSVLDRRTGEERDYVLRGKKALSEQAIRDLAGAVDAAGAAQSKAYPLSRLTRDADDVEVDPGGEDEISMEREAA